MITIIFGLVNTKVAKADTIDYLFQKKFYSLELKNRLKIVRVRHLDGFFLPFSECLRNFYRDTVGVKCYEMEDQKKMNKIAVVEYVFKDTVAASNAFRLVFPYAESIRKTRRKDFLSLCYNIPDSQVYYASQDGARLYVYTIIYNFIYHSREESIDDLMQRDKGILLDDLYRQITKSR
jgi:hypothetical protein